ncbi:hypothetical protein MTBSS4_250020 [Magnetospirillum sp. SS-4]|nr:hypothetical protein MTBSS4_250020 [Magnetospirillum sp. SS-4]
MCGISGLICLDGCLAPETVFELCVAMRDAMTHRGPDDQGCGFRPMGVAPRCEVSGGCPLDLNRGS